MTAEIVMLMIGVIEAGAVQCGATGRWVYWPKFRRLGEPLPAPAVEPEKERAPRRRRNAPDTFGEDASELLKIHASIGGMG